jgi:solute carrier family 35 protein F1/2
VVFQHEFLGLMGAFGTVLSLIQSLSLEHDAIRRGSDHGWDVTTVALLVGFVGFLNLMYTQTSLFLCTGDAALFNLSLLTSDLYAVLFAFVLYGYLVGWMYALALVFIAAGIYTYYAQPPPNPVPMQRLDDEESLSDEVSTGAAATSPRLSDSQNTDTVQLLAHDTLVEPQEVFATEAQ